MSHLNIEAFGPFQVSIDNTPIKIFESVKVNALLAYLAVESDRPHRRETLVGLLWPDFPEKAARHNLRQALFNLRIGIGDHVANPPYLLITRDTIQFNRQSDYSLDVDQFNHGFNVRIDDLAQSAEDNRNHASQLEEILELYRGDFLAHFFLEDSVEFEAWALAKRERLHQQVLEAHNYLTHYYVLHNDFRAAREHAQKQLDLDPWREEAYRQMMQVLALDGERSAALAQYDACKRVLAEELDVEPSAETRELYEQIKQGTIKPKNNQPNSFTGALVKNLPVQLTPFIGRETELSNLSQIITDNECRCITLVGPGGVGKTRLALKTAEQHIHEFTQGAIFIPFAPIGSPEGIIPAIINTLNINFHQPGDPKIHLLSYLSDKEMLLILDNVEHLLAVGLNQEGIAQLSIEILQNAPGIKLLVTSREALNLQGEWIYEVPGLAFPAATETVGLKEFDAVTLFAQRARHVSAGFSIDKGNQADIARICRLVEGMPLAIELAATWMRMLSPAEIAVEIKKSIDFLSTAVHDLPERHRNMRVVFDYSWQMLSKEEQQVLSKLSVFRGGFNREAAEKVAKASLSILSTLVNRTLVRRTNSGRYDLHELIRQYCSNQLASNAEEKDAVEAQHCNFYLNLAETANQELQGGSQLLWLSRLEQEHDNLRASLEWSLENDEVDEAGNELAIRLCAALRWYWRMRGHFHEGIDWLTEVLQRYPKKRSATRARALMGLSLLLNGLGDLAAASIPIEESVDIFRELGDQQGLAEALMTDGLTLLWQGAAAKGHASTKEALAIYRSVNNWWGEAQALYRLGSYLADYGGAAIGRTMLEESAAILEKYGEKYLYTSVLVSLGIVDLKLGDYSTAKVRFERGLTAAREIRHPWGIADVLTNLGCLYRITGDYVTAQIHFEEALEVYREHGRNIWEIDVLCAMAENAIIQGDFPTAHLHLDAASLLLGSSENRLLQSLICYFQGLLAYYEDDIPQAAQLLAETTRLTREAQFLPDLARSLVALGMVRLKQGEPVLANNLLRDALGIFKDIGQKLGFAITFEALGLASIACEDNVKAVRLISASENLRQKMGAPIVPVDRAVNDSAITTLRSRLGEAQFVDIWNQAAGTPLDELVEEILMADIS